MSSLYPPSVGTEQHCYRHPDRVAGVRCQRCARPICPSCMTNASVGFHCPECAHGGTAQHRLVDLNRRQSTPVLTHALIALNVAVFIAATLFNTRIGGVYGDVNGRYGLWGPAIADGEWWRVVTGGFLHANVLHLAFNMWALYVLGGPLELAIGRLRFGIIYAVSLLGGTFGVLLLSPNALTVGASGAIFGLFAAFGVLQLSRGQNPMQSGIGSAILINLVLTFAIPGISIGGHLGGLFAGGLCAAALIGVNPQQARQRAKQVNAMMAVSVGLGVLLGVSGVLLAYAV